MNIPQVRFAYPKYKVFIYGVDVSNDVTYITTVNNNNGAPNTCTIRLNSPGDRYSLTTEDIAFIHKISKLKIPWLAGSLSDDSWFSGTGSASTKEFDPEKYRISDDIKAKILLAKLRISQSVNTELLKDPAGNPLPSEYYKYYGTEIKKYPTADGMTIFHPMDPVRVFMRDPFNPSRWYHHFAGFVSDLAETINENGMKTITVGCEGPTKLLRYTRVFVNPGVVDAKVVIQENDFTASSFHSKFLAGLDLPEIIFTLIFGPDRVGYERLNQKVDSSSGTAPRFTRYRGIGHFAFDLSGIFSFGPDGAVIQQPQVLPAKVDQPTPVLLDELEVRTVDGYIENKKIALQVVPVGKNKRNGAIQYMQRDAAKAYLEMKEAASKDGITITEESGFRTYAQQERLYKDYVNYLADPANHKKANRADKPGYSKHQAGRSMDIADVESYDSALYKWLAKNASRYGFKNDAAGEPWHWTYYGKVQSETPAVDKQDVEVTKKPAVPGNATGLYQIKPDIKLDSLHQWQALIDHEVQPSDMWSLATEVDRAKYKPEELVNLRLPRETSLAADGMLDIEKVIDYIGTHPHEYPVDGGRVMVLLPTSLGKNNRRILLNDVISSYPLNSEWHSAGEIIYDVVNGIQFSMYETPKGDIVVEFPMYDFDPDDFGLKRLSFEQLFTGLSSMAEIVKLASDFAIPSRPRGPFGQGFVVRNSDLVQIESAVADSKIKTIAVSGWQIIQNWSVGNTSTIGKLAVMTRPDLIPLYGVRPADVNLPGYVATPEAAHLLADIVLNKLNADAHTVGINAMPNLRAWVNRPMYIEKRNVLATVKQVTHSIQWGASGNMDTKLELYAVRTWDGQIDGDNVPIFKTIAGGASKPLDYSILMQSRRTPANNTNVNMPPADSKAATTPQQIGVISTEARNAVKKK
jgi:hypothetical protein